MANQWFRMYAEFATDPKVQMMSEANQRRFVMVLCLRCSNDHVTLQDEEVAFQLRISNDEWAQTVVASHVVDRARPEQAHPVELTPVRQHVGEAQVVVCGAE